MIACGCAGGCDSDGGGSGGCCDCIALGPEGMAGPVGGILSLRGPEGGCLNLGPPNGMATGTGRRPCNSTGTGFGLRSLSLSLSLSLSFSRSTEPCLTGLRALEDVGPGRYLSGEAKRDDLERLEAGDKSLVLIRGEGDRRLLRGLGLRLSLQSLTLSLLLSLPLLRGGGGGESLRRGSGLRRTGERGLGGGGEVI